MNLSINTYMVEIISWGSGFCFFGWMIGLFIFWRSNKDEIASDDLYWLVERMLLGTITTYFLLTILGVYNSVWSAVIWFIAVMVYLRKGKTDQWTILDRIVLPIYFFTLVCLIVELFDKVNIGGLFISGLMLTYMLIVHPWVSRNYRTLSWYPSGKPGFLFLLGAIFYLFISLLVDFYQRPSLYWPKLILFSLMLICTYVWFGRVLIKKRGMFKIFKK